MNIRPFLLLMLWAAMAAGAPGQTAEEIIRRSEDLIKGKTCQGKFVMTVTTPSYTRTMEMDSWWVGNEKALILIRSPKKEAGNKTLKIGNELWSYLKNTETTIKLPPSMMLQSWNGSDFTNDDLVRESNLSRDYHHAITGEATAGGERCWVIELLPKPNAPVVWGKVVYWVRKSDTLPASQEYYDEQGTLMRSMIFSEYRVMGGRTLPTRWVMVNRAKAGHQTAFEIKEIRFDVPLKDDIFSFRQLEKRN
jgi:outer membrane lipoprotein-sorting protein